MKIIIKNNIVSALQIKILLCLVICFPAFAQNYEVSTMEVNNNNYSAYLDKKLFIDKDGFLWYSTFNGVVKEIGKDNSIFFEYASPKNKKAVSTNALYQTSNNNLFACTNRGFNILDLKTKTSKWFTVNYPDTDLEVFFTSIKEDSRGNVWLGTDKNYLYCYTNKNELKYFKILESNFPSNDNSRYFESKMEIPTILDDDSIIIKQNNKWFKVSNGKSNLIIDFYKTKKSRANSSTILASNGQVFPLNASGTYLFKNQKYHYYYIENINKQIIEIPYKQGQYIPKSISENFYNILTFISLNQNNLHGFKLEKIDGEFILNEVEKFPFKRKISNVIYDQRGYFWLQTEYGISKVRYTGLGFRKHLDKLDISCRGMAEDVNGDLMLLTYAGIFKKAVNENEFKEIKTTKNKDYDFTTQVSYNFHKIDDDNYWFYGFYNALIHYNVSLDLFTHHKIPSLEISITDLLQIEDSKFLLATSIGLYEFDLNNKQYRNVSDLGDSVSVDKINIRKLFLSKDKSTLWISTDNDEKSLIKINRKTNKKSIFNEDNVTLPLVSNSVKVIYEDDDSNIWLGTEKGLQKINPENYTYTNYTVESGFVNDNIASILEEENNIWVGTFYGLIRISKTSDVIQAYFKKDGLTHNEFNARSAYKHSNGSLYFGGLNGVTSFDPENISKINQDHFSIFLTKYEHYDEDLEVNNEVVILDEEISGFTIPNQNNYLTLKFAINDILNSDKNSFQYRIMEISEEWVNLGNYNTLQLRGLNPGTYDLEVKGFSSNGNPTNILKYEVKINQIFYKQAWFVALNIMGVFLFIIIRNRNRREYLKNSFIQKNKIQKLEAKAMRAQMNPHFIFNTLNGMQSVMILKGERAANKYFSAFSRLLRITLDMSNSEYILLKNEVEYLKSYLELENLRLDNRIDISFNVDSVLNIENNSIPCMLFQPIIENAILHGLTPKKENLSLSVEFLEQDNHLIGIIQDSGIGRKKSQKEKIEKASTHKSWATHIMNERIAISNATMDEKITWKIVDLEDENNNALGTKVILSIPLKKS